MPNKCCKKESTCFKEVAKKTIKFGPTKTIKEGTKKATEKKFVSYGEHKTVTCGKFTEMEEILNCCTC